MERNMTQVVTQPAGPKPERTLGYTPPLTSAILSCYSSVLPCAQQTVGLIVSSKYSLQTGSEARLYSIRFCVFASSVREIAPGAISG